jgi:hypothetical protein
MEILKASGVTDSGTAMSDLIVISTAGGSCLAHGSRRILYGAHAPKTDILASQNGVAYRFMTIGHQSLDSRWIGTSRCSRSPPFLPLQNQGLSGFRDKM